MHAVRNIRLCTKDCLCLYVCPTGATDTETGQIDASRCVEGCRACVDACPSHAISLVPDSFPAQQPKTAQVIHALQQLAESKVEQELAATRLSQTAQTPAAKKLAGALAASSRLMAEDLVREAGFMLPQGKPTRELLKHLLKENQDAAFPREAVEKLLQSL
jgi:ferredoxin